MFCTNCGKQQPDGAKFCTNCGASLAVPKSAGQTMRQPVAQQPAPAPAPTPTPEPDKKPGRGGGIGVAIACAVIVIAAAVAVYFILFAGNSGDSAQVAAAPATTVAASTDTAAEPATTSDTPATTGPASPDAGNGANASAQENVGEVYSSTSSQITVSAYATARQGETPENILSGYENNYPLEYTASGDTWCVASWKSDGYEYYDKCYVTDEYVYYYSFKYPVSAAQAGSDLIEAYIQYFKPGTE